MKHLAVFTGDAIEKVFLGKKTMEGRWSKNRIPPYGKVKTGDTVLMKKSGGKLVGQFKVGKVISFEDPGDKESGWIRRVFKAKLCLPPGFWRLKRGARFITLMEICLPSRFLTPPTNIKKKDRRGWVVLRE